MSDGPGSLGHIWALLAEVPDPEIPAVSVVDLGIVRSVGIETVLAPPWTTDWISDAGKAKLAAYGIAPPDLAKTATCPQCGSIDTEEVSRFGSTPCKAQWRCRACLEPFDRFKCH